MAQPKRERGRQTTAILGNSPATFRRPRRLLAVPRVRSHRQWASGPPGRLAPGCIVEDRGLLRSRLKCERHCRRASVQLVARVHSPDHRPRYVRELRLASAAATVQRLPQPGHRPHPASDAQLLRPLMGKARAVCMDRRWRGLPLLVSHSGQTPIHLSLAFKTSRGAIRGHQRQMVWNDRSVLSRHRRQFPVELTIEASSDGEFTGIPIGVLNATGRRPASNSCPG